MADNIVPEKPLNRTEKYLAIIGGEDYEIPKPLNRIEQYLANIAENGGGGGAGYTVETTETSLVPQQNATTEDTGDGYLTTIMFDAVPQNGDTCVVTFDDTDYMCAAVDDAPLLVIGDENFVDFPFHIAFVDGEVPICVLATAGAGTYSVKVVKQTKAATLTDDFRAAIDAVPLYDLELLYSLTDGQIYYVKGDYTACVQRCSRSDGEIIKPPRFNIYSSDSGSPVYYSVGFGSAWNDGEIDPSGEVNITVTDNDNTCAFIWTPDGNIFID